MGDITVRAVFSGGKFGWDGQARRYDGDVFSIDEAKFSPKWMERVDATVASEPEPTTEPETPVAEDEEPTEERPKRRRRRRADADVFE